MKEEALKGKLHLHLLLFTNLFFFVFFFLLFFLSSSCTMAYGVDDLAEKPSKAWFYFVIAF